MILREVNMFKEDLFKLRNDIYSISAKTEKQLKKNVLESILAKKLERSYNNYAEMITNKINYILSRNNYRVIKALNKIAEEKDENEVDSLDE